MSGFREAAGRRGSLRDTVRAVAWSFLGIRRSSGLEHDTTRLNPVHVVVVGLVLAVVFVVLLVLLVQWVIGSGIAG